jgi:hypothetical protein
MPWRRLLGTAAAVVLPLGVATCGLATDGLAPDTPDAGDPPGTGASGGGQGGGSGGAGSGSSSSGGEATCSGEQVACEAIPAGWAMILTKSADPSQSAGKCADGSTGVLYFTGPAGAPTCSACSCFVDPQATCTAPEITCFFDSNNCSDGQDIVRKANDTGCIPFATGKNPTHTAGSCRLTNPPTVFNAGNCTFLGGSATLPPKWGGALLSCPTGVAQGGCTAGQLCAPKVVEADSSLCILHAGDEPCPASFPKQTDAFLGGTDTRSCTGCGCTVGCSGGSYVVHDLDSCGTSTTDPDVVVNSTTCVPAPNVFDSNIASFKPTVANAGVTACSGGQSQGRVDGTEPRRICCR